MSNIKIIVIDVVQKHIDTTEVVDCEADLLTKEALSYVFFTKYFSELE